MIPKFTVCMPECDSKEWISQKLHYVSYDGDEEFDYWLGLRMTNLEALEWRQGLPKFAAELFAMAPSLLSAEDRAHLYACDDETYLAVQAFEEGMRAPVWQLCGDNPMELMLEAQRLAIHIEDGNLDEPLDRAVNGIGQTGWEAIRNDYSSAYARRCWAAHVHENVNTNETMNANDPDQTRQTADLSV